MSLRIEPFDQFTAPKAELARAHELWCLFDAEYLPDDPPIPLAQRIADFRQVRPNRLQPKWIASVEGRPVGFAEVWIDLDRADQNVFGVVFIRPDARGNGYARPLSGKILEAAAETGRDVLTTETPEGDPTAELLEQLGLKPALKERISRLHIEDLDRELMQSWIDRAGERAGDYEVRLYEIPLPDDVVEDFVTLTDAMNTAPMEDLEEAPREMTVETWRAREKASLDAGETVLSYVAVHKPTGEFAGYTNIVFRSHYPQEAHQHDTAVNPEHRGKGLGRWLKASMILEFTNRFPEVERVDTGNAGSNAPMLNINYEMGFRTVCTVQVYQGPIGPVVEWVKES